MQQTPQYAVTSSNRYFSAVNTTCQVPAAMAVAAGILKVTRTSSLANNHAATAEGGHSAAPIIPEVHARHWYPNGTTTSTTSSYPTASAGYHPVPEIKARHWYPNDTTTSTTSLFPTASAGY
ncbi:MAG: hypothetical protein Q9185_006556 [Variospora sp. 1 TL-2023]